MGEIPVPTTVTGGLLFPAAAPGLTLRDYFAAQVIGAIVQKFDYTSADERAQIAYTIADAMLAARRKENAT